MRIGTAFFITVHFWNVCSIPLNPHANTQTGTHAKIQQHIPLWSLWTFNFYIEKACQIFEITFHLLVLRTVFFGNKNIYISNYCSWKSNKISENLSFSLKNMGEFLRNKSTGDDDRAWSQTRVFYSTKTRKKLLVFAMKQMIVQSKKKIQIVMEVKMNSNNGKNEALKRNSSKMYTKKGSYFWKKLLVFACKWIFQHL